MLVSMGKFEAGEDSDKALGSEAEMLTQVDEDSCWWHWDWSQRDDNSSELWM